MSNLTTELKEIFSNLALSGSVVGDPPYIVGGFVRDYLLDLSLEEIKDLDVISKYGKTEELINDFVTSNGLGEPKLFEYTGTKTVFFKNFKVEFQSATNSNVHYPIEEEMKKAGIEVNYLNKNIYERDFTVNSICYDVSNGKIFDLTGYGISDLNNKLLRTPINPDAAIGFNPLIILRGFRFMCEFGFSMEEEYSRAVKRGVHLLTEATKTRDKRFLNKIIRDTFSFNKRVADQLYREYNIYNLIEMPKDIMEDKIKSDMGIKYIAKYDTLYKVSNNNLHIIKDYIDLVDNDQVDGVRKLAALLYINNIIDEKTKISFSDSGDYSFNFEDIEKKLNLIENNKMVSYAQMSNMIYERYKRRKEYRDRKRREEKRDRINKMKFWREFQKKY